MRLHYGTAILNPGLIQIAEVLAREHFLLCTILMIHHYDNLQNKSKLAQTDLQWLNTKYRDVFLNLRNHFISIILSNKNDCYGFNSIFYRLFYNPLISKI